MLITRWKFCADNKNDVSCSSNYYSYSSLDFINAWDVGFSFSGCSFNPTGELPNFFNDPLMNYLKTQSQKETFLLHVVIVAGRKIWKF